MHAIAGAGLRTHHDVLHRHWHRLGEWEHHSGRLNYKLDYILMD